ncbi:MAG: GNAT family N-acetyltransferase [Bacteroidota bacterium]
MDTYQFRNKETATALYDAFRAEPFYLALAEARTNRTETVESVLLKYFDYSIQEAQQYGICQTTDDPKIGAALWHIPKDDTLQNQQTAAKKAFVCTHLGVESWRTYQKIAKSMAQVAKKHINPDFWYLSILAVAKAYQGQGRGRQLVVPVLTKADRANKATYLETFTPENLIFYGKLGYQVAVAFVEPTLRKTGWILVHPSA